MTSIGEWAFYECDNLTSVTIGNSVTSIDDCAFGDCYKLIEVKNLSALNITAGSSDCGYVGYYAKRVYTEGESYLSTDEDGYIIYDDGTDKILVGYTGTETDLTLPSGITQINQYAFYYCSSLTSIEIPDSVTSIGEKAFYNCRSLKSVTIGNSVTSISYGAFRYCSSLTSVTFKNPNGWWRSSDSTATSGTSISSSDLANPSIAAKYLTSTDYYCDCYWKRS
ncbi:MAG: leucine-rich repeat domain-containing protein [Candidatus Gallimonas sp.]